MLHRLRARSECVILSWTEANAVPIRSRRKGPQAGNQGAIAAALLDAPLLATSANIGASPHDWRRRQRAARLRPPQPSAGLPRLSADVPPNGRHADVTRPREGATEGVADAIAAASTRPTAKPNCFLGTKGRDQQGIRRRCGTYLPDRFIGLQSVSGPPFARRPPLHSTIRFRDLWALRRSTGRRATVWRCGRQRWRRAMAP